MLIKFIGIVKFSVAFTPRRFFKLKKDNHYKFRWLKTKIF
jgi:hypothetical protein